MTGSGSENAHGEPLSFGKGPPAGRGIGRQMGKQLVGTGEADYDMRNAE